ncbi:MAG TPA: hypothetical protein VN581_00160 [Patescibacteria group bacterium]|nr:hypothetical protein [Patescibacteria group bacterium]
MAERSIRRTELPAHAMLRRYLHDGHYADCYVVEVPMAVSQAEFVEAFYTTPLFKLERAILAAVVRKPSTDADARALAHGECEAFAAWTVENRSDTQLLLADFMGRTRSWLMAEPTGIGGTRLHFGSAVVPKRDRDTVRQRPGGGFGLMLGLHKLYSRALLASARHRLRGKLS